ERYSDVLRKLGFQVDLSDPIFPAKRDLSPEILKLVPSDHKKWIGIAPFAKHNAKMYPLDLMEIVIKKLDNTNKYRIFLFGGGKLEIDALKILESKFKNAISVAGTIDFTNEINLISNLDCMLSMDSANGHLGAIQGINVITIWGATHPFAGFAPFNQPKENMLLPDLKKFPNIPCSIYGNKNCIGYEDVMRTIPPENITAKIKEIV
ncbi:MAG: glycosyltransferase family 9 protein, partial [Aureibaculum sp.]